MSSSEATVAIGAKQLGGLAWSRQALAHLNSRLADRAEQAIVVGLNALLCWRLLPEDLRSAHWFVLMLLVSESTVVIFTLLRRPSEKLTVRPADWFVAFAGTVTVLLVEGGSEPFLPEIGFGIMFAGWILHFGAKLTLRRSFGIVPANRGVKTDGIYSLIRHPMYFGYLVTHVGFFLSVPSVWNFLIYAIAWAFIVLRIRAEERILMEEPRYRAYTEKVRYRLLPLLW